MTIARPLVFCLATALGMALIGCQQDRMSNIPSDAQMVSSGNSSISYTAASDGRIWVYDVAKDRIVYGGAVGMNQTVLVDPVANQITVNGQDVHDKDLANGTQYRVFFLPGNTGLSQ
jgi:hypothetical protein